MIVRLKVEARDKEGQPINVFQFYDSPIKRLTL